MVLREIPAPFPHGSNAVHHVHLGNQLPVHLDAFAERDQMRRGKQTHAQARRAVNAFQHGTGGTLAVGAGHVDEAQAFFWMARAGGEFAGGVQPQPGAKHPQPVEELDGFRVVHKVNSTVQRFRRC